MAYPDLTDHEQAAAWARAYVTLHPIPDFHLGPRDDHQLQRWLSLAKERRLQHLSSSLPEVG